METTDLVIIGAGAAGLTAAQYGARANLETVILEELAPGGQALVIDRLENYPGFDDPVTGFEFSERMRKQAENFGASFRAESVSSVEKRGDAFVVTTDRGELGAKAVIVATGSKHKISGCKGEEEFSGRGVSYCATCDGPFFKGKRMVVIGGGDAACDEAMFLSKLASDIVMVHRRDRFRAQASLAARVLANPKIKVMFNSVVTEILGEKRVQAVTISQATGGDPLRMETDAVFVFVGMEPQAGFLKGVQVDGTGAILTDQRMETNVKGLFAAGDVRATPFRQVVTAAGEGAVAAYCAAQYIDEQEGKAYR